MRDLDLLGEKRKKAQKITLPTEWKRWHEGKMKSSLFLPRKRQGPHLRPGKERGSNDSGRQNVSAAKKRMRWGTHERQEPSHSVKNPVERKRAEEKEE